MPAGEKGSPPNSGNGFMQLFGIDPRIAFLTFIVDLMLFGAEGITLGNSIIFQSIPAGFLLAYITFKAQRSWYGDNHDSALIKAMILGLLTAIPTALPALIYVPSGILGLAHSLLSKRPSKVSATRN